MKSNYRVLFLIVVSLLLAAPVLAQTHRASLRGTVYDVNKAAVPGMTITLTNTATGERRTTTSGEDGSYAISSLPAGVYELEVQEGAFRKYTKRFELLVNQEERHDISLEVAGPAVVDEYSIESSTAGVKKDSASLGTVIENRQVTGLPLDGRNFYELSLLVPGALVASLLLATPVAAAAPNTPRHDTFVEIWCDSDASNGDGTGAASITPGDASAEGGVEDDVLAKRVDARAIQPDKDPGGKDTATERYNEHAGLVQGWFCGEL